MTSVYQQPVTGYGAAYFILGQVRDAIQQQLQSTSTSISRVGIVPGAIAWDGCDDCGQLALAAQRFYLTDNFPVEVATSDMGHGSILGMDAVVQAIRCAPTVGVNGAPPTTSAFDASAQQVLDDAFACLCATQTVLENDFNTGVILAYLIRQQVFVGPEGACVGSELSFAVGIQR